ncbi:T9SS type A sorting domain-containing protein [Parabacteroides sp. FAFU027]|uniref:T9SS type A sorting domain-containing protein n=1 Tax=Parabacteroides sp. FAFU027 TaxID=2922715 RepID=UPI001FAF0B84|nr:T9SS type A sorting domain-containing protein [Parabacteroides sp. FAFU027]
MKRSTILAGTIMCLVFFISSVKSQERGMVVALKSGITNSLKIRNISRMNFSSSMLYINTFNGSNVVYANSDIQKIYFETVAEASTPKNEQNEFVLYPNPTKGMIYFRNQGVESASVSIFNLNGAMLFSGRIYNSTQSLDLSFLARGVYLVKIDNQLTKLIKL